MSSRHLAKRFFGALWPGGPRAADEAWVRTVIGDGGAGGLWSRMSGPDRRHAVGVARTVAVTLGGDQATPPVLAAALLHDVGKISAGFGTLARVPATLVGLAGGRRRAGAWAASNGRVRRRLGLYLDHAEVGARLLADAGADPITVRWAAEHHLPAGSWTLPPAIAVALKAADDD